MGLVEVGEVDWEISGAWMEVSGVWMEVSGVWMEISWRDGKL